MGNSLRDQMLKAGLVDDKKVKQAKIEEHQKNKQKGKNKTGNPDEAKLKAQQALIEKAERDRLLNRDRKEAAERKAVTAQIKQLIEVHRLPKSAGDVPYNFVDENIVKTVLVSAAVHEQISRGQSAIVKAEGQYDVVPAVIADKIRVRDASSVIVCLDPRQGDGGNAGEDPYADYKVPDDLMW